MSAEARGQLVRDGVARDDQNVRAFAEIRYCGQFNELSIPISADGPDNDEISCLRELFEAKYHDTFGPGSTWQGAQIEITGFRLEAIGVCRHGLERWRPAAPEPSGRPPAAHARRSCYWTEFNDQRDTDIYIGTSLGRDDSVRGPAVIEFATTTVLVPPQWACRCDELGNLHLGRERS